MSLRSESVLTLVLAIFLLIGCKGTESLTGSQASNSPSNANSTTAKANNSTAAPEPNEDGTIPSGTGIEKEKPAPGKGNVQGKALFNEKPAAGVQVKLCKTFSQFMGGCKDAISTKTDDAGEYLIKDVTPGIYEALIVYVFDTPYYVFSTSGILSAAKYNIEADKTFFAPDTHLFKNDIKVTAPKASAKVAPENVEVKWDPYPDAAYYKLSVYADTSTGAEAPYDYIGRRVDDVSIVMDKPLKPGGYNVKVQAFNANDRKLAENSNDIKFTVK